MREDDTDGGDLVAQCGGFTLILDESFQRRSTVPPNLLLRSEDLGVPKLYPCDRVQVTLWTYRREPLLGCWTGIQWNSTPLGRAAQECWRDLPREYPAWRFELFAMQPRRFDALIQISRSNSTSTWSDAGAEPILETIRPMVAVFKARVARRACDDCDHFADTPQFRPWQLGYELRRLDDEASWRLALRDLSCRLLGLIRD